MIRTEALTKRYGSVLAVDGVGLDVRPGDIYGFLGANGSGKTTTVRMLLGLVFPTSGHIEIFGESVPAARRRVLPRIGALVEGPAAYGHLSGRANLMLIDASAHAPRGRRDRVEAALERAGLDEVGRRPVKAYSLGMRQRLGLAAAMLRAPELLVLDEPTNGLDPQGIREVRDLLLQLHAQGTTVFLSSHMLAEIEQLCTRIGVLDRGRLVLQEQLADLRLPTGRTLVTTPDVQAAKALLNGRVGSVEGDRLVIAEPDPAWVNRWLVEQGIRVTELSAERRTLEQVVLEVTTASGDRHSAATGPAATGPAPSTPAPSAPAPTGDQAAS